MAEPPPSADEIDLSVEDRAHIDGMFLRLASSDLYELLGVPRGSERRAIRDAYFALSQRFHPDAYFGRRLGPWKQRMEEVFRELTRAYDILSNKNRRAEYDATLPALDPSARPGPTAPATAYPDPSPSRAAANTAPPAAPPPPSPSLSATNPMGPIGTANTIPAMNATPLPASASAPSTAATATATATARAPANGPTAPAPADRSGPVRVMTAEMEAQRPQAPMQRAGETSGRQAVPTAPTGPAPVAIDPEVARRAAREAIARKLSGGRAPSGTMPSVKHNPPPPSPPRPSPTPRDPNDGPLTSPMDSFAAMRVDRMEAERRARIHQLVARADEAIGQKDFVTAANALGMASGLDPADTALKARADEAGQRMAESQVEKNVEHARAAERAGSWELAALHWQRASTGRPRDVSLLERAAMALVRGNKDLSRAAELARKAIQLAPQRVEALTTLAQVFLAGGMRASAIGALEAASKLDPNSPVVKDLMTKAKS